MQKVLAGGQFILVLASRFAELRRGTDRPRHEALSERELQVCKLTAIGMSVKEIAATLSLSAKTISTFHCRVFEKLAVKNDAELGTNEH